MPVYLIIAYIVFTVVPFGLWLSISMRHKKIKREIVSLENE